MHIAKEVNLFEHKNDNIPYNFVHKQLLVHLKGKNYTTTKMKHMYKENMVLTADEVKLVVGTATMMANMSLGIDPERCLDMINNVLKIQIDSRDFEPMTIGVVKQIMANNTHLLRLVHAASV